jgi:hypothetical protein
MVSGLVDRCASENAHYMAHIQEQMAAQMADRIAAEVAKNTKMSVGERPDLHGSVECQMRYEPTNFNSGTTSTYTSDEYGKYVFGTWNGDGTVSVGAPVSMKETPKLVDESFSVWYADLKREIDRWLN